MTSKFFSEVRAQAVRMVLDSEGEHPSRWAAIVSVASKIGCAGQSLRQWVGKADVDSGRRHGLTTEIAAKMKALECEVREPGRPTRSCARHQRILPRRNSTARLSDDYVDR